MTLTEASPPESTTGAVSFSADGTVVVRVGSSIVAMFKRDGTNMVVWGADHVLRCRESEQTRCQWYRWVGIVSMRHDVFVGDRFYPWGRSGG